MYFRPFPVLTLVAIPAVAALLWLGTWQAGRAGWKAGLIEDYERAASSVPQPVEAVLCAHPDGVLTRDDLYQPIDGASVASLLGGWPPEGKAIRMFGQTAAGATGWRHFTTIDPPDCIAGQGSILVEGPFEPFDPAGAAKAPRIGPAPARYSAVLWPARPVFAAANAPDRNDWHWFDAGQMATAFGVPRINDKLYLAITPDTLPVHLTRTPPATHIGYSVTWYGMAIAFVVIYAVFHARAGRLRFGKRDTAQQ